MKNHPRTRLSSATIGGTVDPFFRSFCGKNKSSKPGRAEKNMFDMQMTYLHKDLNEDCISYD